LGKKEDKKKNGSGIREWAHQVGAEEEKKEGSCGAVKASRAGARDHKRRKWEP
jgi:hypothetical protein